MAESASIPDKKKLINYIGLFQLVLTLVFVAAIIWFIAGHDDEIATVFVTLRHGNWFWLIGSIILVAYYFYLEAWCFERTLAIVSVKISKGVILLNLLAAQVVGVVTPTEWLGIQAMFVNQAIKSGQSRSRIMLGAMLSQFAELYSFCIILALGMLFLFLRHSLNEAEIISLIIILIFVLISLSFLAIVAYRPDNLKSFIDTLNRVFGRFTKKGKIIAADQMEALYEGLYHSSHAIRSNPFAIYQAIIIALVGHIVRILALWLVAKAFALTLSIPQAAIAYCFGNLAWVISPVPQGIGLVEGAYAVALAKLGLPIAGAASLALAFRGVTFWLPFIIGLGALRIIHRKTPILATSQPAKS